MKKKKKKFRSRKYSHNYIYDFGIEWGRNLKENPDYVPEELKDREFISDFAYSIWKLFIKNHEWQEWTGFEYPEISVKENSIYYNGILAEDYTDIINVFKHYLYQVCIDNDYSGSNDEKAEDMLNKLISASILTGEPDCIFYYEEIPDNDIENIVESFPYTRLVLRPDNKKNFSEFYLIWRFMNYMWFETVPDTDYIYTDNNREYKEIFGNMRDDIYERFFKLLESKQKFKVYAIPEEYRFSFVTDNGTETYQYKEPEKLFDELDIANIISLAN